MSEEWRQTLWQLGAVFGCAAVGGIFGSFLVFLVLTFGWPKRGE